MHFRKLSKAGEKKKTSKSFRIILKAQTAARIVPALTREEDLIIHGASGTVLRKVLPHL